MRFLIAWSMIVLLGMFYISCGGTNKASRTVSTGSDSYVNCNQNLWYAYSGCMPPTTWTVPSNFVLPAAWYPSVLGYDYPSWYTEAGLKVSFRSTCNDVGNCNRLTLQESEFYETDPIIRDDANTVYHSFRFDRIISGLGFMGDTSLQWSSSYDKELQASGYSIFNSDGKLDVAIRVNLDKIPTSGAFNDYWGSRICTSYSSRYTLVGGTLYARRVNNDGTYQSLAEAKKVNFVVESGAEKTFSLNKASQGNAALTSGKYILEIRDLTWNAVCLFNAKKSPSAASTYCNSSSDLKALGPNPLATVSSGENKGVYYGCVELEIAISWNAYTPDVNE